MAGKLTKREKLKFARSYALHGDATKAYLDIRDVKKNTARVNGCNLRKLPDVQQMIEDERKKISSEENMENEQLIADKQEILMFYTNVIRQNIKIKKVRSDHDGARIETWDYPNNKMMSDAAEKLARFYGMFDDHQTVDIGDNTLDAIKDVSLSELQELVEGITKEFGGE